MSTYKVDALILKKRNYYEADRLITVFGRGTGKAQLRARGVRKVKSKLAGHLETFSRTHLVVAKTKGIDLITQANIQEPFIHIRTELPRMSEAFYALELLDKVTPEGFKDSRLFDFVITYLRELDLAPEEKLSTLRHGFETKLVFALGFGPDLKHCAEDQKKHEGDVVFDAASLGFYCEKHGERVLQKVRITHQTQKTLSFLESETFQTLRRLQVPINILQELERVLTILLENISERKIVSKKFLNA